MNCKWEPGMSMKLIISHLYFTIGIGVYKGWNVYISHEVTKPTK